MERIKILNMLIYLVIYMLSYVCISTTNVKSNFSCTPGDHEKCSYSGICESSGNSCKCYEGYFTTNSSDDYYCDSKHRDSLQSFVKSVADNFGIIRKNSNEIVVMDDFSCVPGDRTKCSYNGECQNDGLSCHCYDEYTTYNPPEGYQCNYKKKSALTAFLLEFFLGEFGAGLWYLGNYGLAAGQLAMSIGICIPASILLCLGAKEFSATLVGLSQFGLLIWIVIEWAFIINGHRTDGNGVPTESM